MKEVSSSSSGGELLKRPGTDAGFRAIKDEEKEEEKNAWWYI
jgi:hypothetical protein